KSQFLAASAVVGHTERKPIGLGYEGTERPRSIRIDNVEIRLWHGKAVMAVGAAGRPDRRLFRLIESVGDQIHRGPRKWAPRRIEDTALIRDGRHGVAWVYRPRLRRRRS